MLLAARGARCLSGEPRAVHAFRTHTEVVRKGLTVRLISPGQCRRGVSSSFFPKPYSNGCHFSKTSADIHRNTSTCVRGYARHNRVGNAPGQPQTPPPPCVISGRRGWSSASRPYSTSSSTPPPNGNSNSGSSSSSSSSRGWSYTLTPTSIPFIFFVLIPLHAISVAATGYVTWGYLLSPEWKATFSAAAQTALLKTSIFVMQSSELRETGKTTGAEIITVLLQVSSQSSQ